MRRETDEHRHRPAHAVDGDPLDAGLDILDRVAVLGEPGNARDLDRRVNLVQPIGIVRCLGSACL